MMQVKKKQKISINEQVMVVFFNLLEYQKDHNLVHTARDLAIGS
jgi:hypothetical protein